MSLHARFVGSSPGRLLLATASVVALQSVLAAGAANAVVCLTSGSTITTNPNALQGTQFFTIGSPFNITVPINASNFTAVMGITPNTATDGTDNGYDGASACGPNANANGLEATAIGNSSNAINDYRHSRRRKGQR